MHRIQLRDPWQMAPSSTPSGWRATRRFNAPTGITPSDQVWLIIEALPVGSTVELSGTRLVQANSNDLKAKFDITGHVARGGEVQITVASAIDHGIPTRIESLVGRVYLAIAPLAPPAN